MLSQSNQPQGGASRLKLLDVTLRDGGFVNGFSLSDAAAMRIISLLDGSDVDGIEIGYLTGLPDNHGQYAAPGICYAWTAERIAELAAKVRTPLVGMFHPGGPGSLHAQDLAQAGLSMVRLPISPGKGTGWRKYTDTLAGAHLRYTVNLTLATWASRDEILMQAQAAAEAGAEVFYLADTNSAFLPHQVEELYRMLSEQVDISLGFHAHDGKRLAQANVLASFRGGAEWVDGSLAALGRGAGNAATEVLHELLGRDALARQILLRGLPQVLDDFGAPGKELLWQQLCAFMDLWPPAIDFFEAASAEYGIDKYALVAERVLGKALAQPPKEADLRAMLTPGAADK